LPDTRAPWCEADVVIVGGGSAGCVLARRLADARPGMQVLLLEAGEGRGNFFNEIPGMTVRLMGQPASDWCYQAEPDPSLRGRVLYWSGGRMLGGSSGINGLVYIRGLRRDYDDWAAGGCPGWSWRGVEPYFRRAEHFEQGDLESLGREGPYTVSRIRSLHPLTERFVAACREFGAPEIVDYNRGEGEGAFVNLTSQACGRRSSTGNRYLARRARSANLRVELGVLVDRVIFDVGRAVGVQCVVGGETREVRARAAVIVSAGTLQSPAVLMRSGIGSASALRELNLDVRRDASGVGRNLQDHCGLTISKFVNVPTYNSEASGAHAVRHLCNYVAFRKGPLASAAVQAMGWVRSDPVLGEPDIHLNWLPFGVDYTVSPPALHKQPCVSLGVCVSRPHSRGEVRLRSTSALDKPVIDHRLVGDERDVATIKRSIGLMERIFTMPALAGAVVGACNPPALLESDAALDDFVRAHAGIGYHAVGTCRMGSDEQAVVDPLLRVRGVDALRVIDASIMPRLVSANTNAASIMIGEKGADLVLQDLR
jgi:choline dehydrogenase-like flavoprotein